MVFNGNFTIFQFYLKPEYSEKISDLLEVTDKHYHKNATI
jgi:hypothetical protein